MSINTNKRIAVTGMSMYGNNALLECAKDDAFALLSADDVDGLMLESVTLEEVEHYYMGDADIVQAQSAMFEAITTQRQQLATTMRAFTKVLNRGLNGTNIKAGTEESSDTDDTGSLVGGALISKVRRISGIPVVAAKIPLSDGQSTSIVFHSPTSNGKTVVNSDLMVAFQFLINKRDVTHVVAPIGGRDVSLAQVAQSLSNLIEKNSGKFKKQQEKQAKLKEEIESVNSESDRLEEQRSAMLVKLNETQTMGKDSAQKAGELSKQVADQKATNAELQKELIAITSAPSPVGGQGINDNIRSVKQSINIDGMAKLSDGSTIHAVTVDDGEPKTYAILKTVAGDIYQLQAKDMQGNSVNDAVGTIFKSYRNGTAKKYQVTVAADDKSGAPETQNSTQPPVDEKQVLQGDPNELLKSAISLMSKLQPFDGYSPAVIRQAAQLDIAKRKAEAIKRQQAVNSVIMNADGSEFSALPPDHELASFAAKLVIYGLGKDADRKSMGKAIGASLSRTKERTVIARLEKANSLLSANGLNPLNFGDETPQQEPETEAVEEPQGFRYALVNRPAGIGAVPDGQSAILPKDENDPYSQYARNGVIVYPHKLTDEQMSQYELKYLPTQDEYQQYAVQLAQESLSDYSKQYIELAKEDASTFAKNVSLQFKKAFPNVAYPLGADLDIFTTDVIAALNDIVQPGNSQPDTGSETGDDGQPDPMDIAQANMTEIADIAGSSVEAIGNWWMSHGAGNDALAELKDALTAAPSTANIEALKTAVDFGSPFGASDVKPLPEPEPENDADKESLKAIDYLKSVVNMQSSDMAEIRNARSQVREAIQAITNAGLYEENETLVDEAAQRLSTLLAAIAQNGGQ